MKLGKTILMGILAICTIAAGFYSGYAIDSVNQQLDFANSSFYHTTASNTR